MAAPRRKRQRVRQKVVQNIWSETLSSVLFVHGRKVNPFKLNFKANENRLDIGTFFAEFNHQTFPTQIEGAAILDATLSRAWVFHPGTFSADASYLSDGTLDPEAGPVLFARIPVQFRVNFSSNQNEFDFGGIAGSWSFHPHYTGGGDIALLDDRLRLARNIDGLDFTGVDTEVDAALTLFYKLPAGDFVADDNAMTTTLTRYAVSFKGLDYKTNNSTLKVRFAPGTHLFLVDLDYLSNNSILQTEPTLQIPNLFMWGSNTYGEIGRQPVNTLVPTTTDTKLYTSIAVGQNFRLGIDSLGRLWAIGNNESGQLGILDNAPRNSPVQVSPGVSWLAVAAGTSHAVGIRIDGSMWTWGANDSGQLGIGSLANQNSPTACIAGSSFSKVAAGASHSMAVRSDGVLFTWGGNANGQLGRNDFINSSDPVQIGSLLWDEVACGEQCSAGIRSNGNLYTWGFGNTGQLGHGNSTTLASPVQISGGGTWDKVAVGGSSQSSSFEYMVAIKSDRTLWSWGGDLGGRLGIGSTLLGANVPTRVKSATGVDFNASWISIACGESTTYAIQMDNSLWSWGLGQFGLRGSGDNVNVSFPVKVGSSSWTSVKAGWQNAAAIGVDAFVKAWGQDYFGEFNRASSSARHSPVLYTVDHFKKVSTGAGHTLAIRNDGILFASGHNDYGQLGDGTTTQRESPVQIGAMQWHDVAAGQSFSVAIRADGTLWTWGLNIVGELGSNSSANRSSPVQVGTLSWVQIATNWNFTLAIRSDLKLFAWGQGTNGKLGNGSVSNQSSPVQVGTSDWAAVACGLDHAAAIDVAGRLFTWGIGAQGQLGSSGTGARSSPGQVLGSWKSVSCGDQHVLGIKINDMVFAWGQNTNGQLGLGDLSNRSSPTQIGTQSWLNVNGAYQASMAIRDDQELFSWGDNRYGQRGDYIQKSSSPVQVTGLTWGDATHLTGWTTIAAVNSTTPPPYRPTLTFDADENILDVNFRRVGISFQDLDYACNGSVTVNLRAVGQLLMTPDFVADSDNLAVTLSARAQLFLTHDAGGTHFTGAGTETVVLTAIAPLGNLWAWGDNVLGGLGLGQGPTGSPVAADSGTYTKVAFGRGWSIRLDTIGQMWACGGNDYGQLGDGTIIWKSSPVQIGIGSSWIDVSAGNWHAAAVRSDGALFTWGLNSTGQLGDATLVNKSSPIQIGTSSWLKVAAGGAFTAAIRLAGGLFTWGFNSNGQLGNNTTTTSSSPVQIGASSWTKVYACNTAMGAITSVATLFMWGNNGGGRLGDGTGTARSSPVGVFNGGSWSQISMGEDAGGGKHTLGINSVGALFAWGGNPALRILNRNPAQAIGPSSPVAAMPGSWIAIAAGGESGWAVRLDGSLWTYGENISGECGLGTFAVVSSPVQVGAGSWTNVFTTWDLYIGASTSDDGANFRNYPVAGIRSTGALFAWGSNSAGEFGTGSPTLNVFAAKKLDTQSWKSVANGFDHSLFVRNDGALFAMGGNRSGQLGDGTTVHKSSPVQIGTSSWLAVAAGRSFSVAIRADGGLFTWGTFGADGRLGDTAPADRSSPVQIGTSSWIAIACGRQHTMAIRLGGSLFSWGRGTSGQLGDSSGGVNRSSPFQVGASTWSKVSCGSNYSHMIDSVGRLFTCGISGPGLGVPPALGVSSPVQIGTSSWLQVAAGDLHTLAIRSDGGLFTWGSNTVGQLGSGTITDRSSPVQIGTSSWVQVGGTDQASSAIRLDGSLWTWGDNTVAQLGLERPATSSPVQVGALTNWVKLGKGMGGMMALTS